MKKFIIIIAVMLTGCGTVQRNTIEEMKPDLERLEPEAAAPVWQSDIEAQTADIMELLPGNRPFDLCLELLGLQPCSLGLLRVDPEVFLSPVGLAVPGN